MLLKLTSYSLFGKSKNYDVTKGGKQKDQGCDNIYIYIMWHRGLAEQLSLLCDSFVSDRLLDVRNFMINNNKIAEFIFLDVFSSPVAVTVKS